MYKKILVPLDGSAVAEVALPHAIEMAKIFQAELILLRVAFVHFLPGSDPVELESAAVRESEAYLERVAQRLTAEGLQVHTVVRYGKAAEEIIDHAAENQVSVIVMATHGRSGVGRWLLGSTAEKVLRGDRGACPADSRQTSTCRQNRGAINGQRRSIDRRWPCTCAAGIETAQADWVAVWCCST